MLFGNTSKIRIRSLKNMITINDLKKETEEIYSKLESMGVNPNEQLYEFLSFVQPWGSTALGFGGIGGQMLTSAITTVVGREDPDGVPIFYVFFGGRFAYAIKNPNRRFHEDMHKGHMAAVYEIGKYRD